MFALIAVLMAVDTVIDYRQSGSFSSQTFEILVFVAALGGHRRPGLAALLGTVANRTARP